MTFREDSGGEDPPSPGAYEVGYGKPPVEHRFKKGQSGNRLGRPRKPKSTKRTCPNDFGAQPANAYLLEEAYRKVTVREGERVIELPALQAVFRAMGVSAMKGNRFAQRTLAELVQTVEAEDRKSRLEHLETMIDYKCGWEQDIEHARQLGLPEPQPIPHPDDVVIDFIAGSAHVCGPMTKEDKVEWDRLLEHMDQLQLEVSHYAAAYRRARNVERKERALHSWKFEQKLFDKLNDDLPKRYRRDLKDRCWEKGATRPGEQRKRVWPGES
jgi:hypothetical protein